MELVTLNTIMVRVVTRSPIIEGESLSCLGGLFPVREIGTLVKAKDS